MSGYHLERVPQPPTNGKWFDTLRWIVAVIDADDPDLEFAVGLLEQCIKCHGLTDKQVLYAAKIRRRIEAHFDAGTLDAQIGEVAG